MMSNDFHYQIRIQRDDDESPSYLSKGGGVAKFDSIHDAKWDAEKYAAAMHDSISDRTEVAVVQVSEKVVSVVSRYRTAD